MIAITSVIVKVYPRVCGGSGAKLWLILPQVGLSPRVRGKRRPLRLEYVAARSIPACAGEASLCARTPAG